MEKRKFIAYFTFCSLLCIIVIGQESFMFYSVNIMYI